MDTPLPTQITFSAFNLQTLTILASFFGAAALISIFGGMFARRMVSLSRLAPEKRRPSLERTRTLKSLLSSGITFMAFFLACIASLALFIPISTLIWILGLFSAAFGFGAKPFVSDLLAGIGFIFNVTFDIGEKVEFFLPPENIQGVVEEINLTTTLVRSSTGEMYTLPNGEIRIVRNFSRGKFSNANFSLFVTPQDVGRATEVLKSLCNEIFTEVNDLLEPYQVVGSTNLTGSKVEIIIVAKAAFGKAAELRLTLMDRIQERLRLENIELAG
ncbi:MAG: mechanosensitive ion channel family protein [Leptolinea sp.]|jgi:small conductance mechanosensitive channel|nr:mechanosensitive ion channel family protein [Leptolinea sp.]